MRARVRVIDGRHGSPGAAGAAGGLGGHVVARQVNR